MVSVTGTVDVDSEVPIYYCQRAVQADKRTTNIEFNVNNTSIDKVYSTGLYSHPTPTSLLAMVFPDPSL